MAGLVTLKFILMNLRLHISQVSCTLLYSYQFLVLLLPVHSEISKQILYLIDFYDTALASGRGWQISTELFCGIARLEHWTRKMLLDALIGETEGLAGYSSLA